MGWAFKSEAWVYCCKYGCRYLWDGLQSEGASEHIYPVIQASIQEEVTKLCRAYGVIRESLVYHISRTDHVLYKKGITNRIESNSN